MMKVKKFYTGAIIRGLNHEKAKCLCLQNPDMVLTRREWIGYHFVKDGGYYVLTRDGIMTHLGSVADDLSDKVHNINDKDWIVAFRSRVGLEVEQRANN